MDEPNTQTTPQTQQPSSSVASEARPPKEKHSRAFSFVSILFLLALLTAGIMTYLWYNQKADSEQLSNEVASAKSAQAALQSQIDKLKKQNANLGDAVVDQVANGTPATTDDDMIKATVGARVHAAKDGASTKYTINYVKKELPFARAGVSIEQGGGYACWLKKSDDIWLILFCGQAPPLQAELDIWGVPSSILN